MAASNHPETKSKSTFKDQLMATCKSQKIKLWLIIHLTLLAKVNLWTHQAAIRFPRWLTLAEGLQTETTWWIILMTCNLILNQAMPVLPDSKLNLFKIPTLQLRRGRLSSNKLLNRRRMPLTASREFCNFRCWQMNCNSSMRGWNTQIVLPRIKRSISTGTCVLSRLRLKT